MLMNNVVLLKQAADGLERLCFISIAMSALSAGWLWLVIWRRDLWFRYVAAEASFYTHLRLPSKYVDWRRRFAEGRAEVYFIAFMFGLFLVLSAISGYGHFHFKTILEEHQ